MQNENIFIKEIDNVDGVKIDGIELNHIPDIKQLENKSIELEPNSKIVFSIDGNDFEIKGEETKIFNLDDVIVQYKIKKGLETGLEETSAGESEVLSDGSSGKATFIQSGSESKVYADVIIRDSNETAIKSNSITNSVNLEQVVESTIKNTENTEDVVTIPEIPDSDNSNNSDNPNLDIDSDNTNNPNLDIDNSNNSDNNNDNNIPWVDLEPSIPNTPNVETPDSDNSNNSDNSNLDTDSDNSNNSDNNNDNNNDSNIPWVDLEPSKPIIPDIPLTPLEPSKPIIPDIPWTDLTPATPIKPNEPEKPENPNNSNSGFIEIPFVPKPEKPEENKIKLNVFEGNTEYGGDIKTPINKGQSSTDNTLIFEGSYKNKGVESVLINFEYPNGTIKTDVVLSTDGKFRWVSNFECNNFGEIKVSFATSSGLREVFNYNLIETPIAPETPSIPEEPETPIIPETSNGGIINITKPEIPSNEKFGFVVFEGNEYNYDTLKPLESHSTTFDPTLTFMGQSVPNDTIQLYFIKNNNATGKEEIVKMDVILTAPDGTFVVTPDLVNRVDGSGWEIGDYKVHLSSFKTGEVKDFYFTLDLNYDNLKVSDNTENPQNELPNINDLFPIEDNILGSNSTSNGIININSFDKICFDISNTDLTINDFNKHILELQNINNQHI